jgi:hypothetical protein
LLLLLLLLLLGQFSAAHTNCRDCRPPATCVQHHKQATHIQCIDQLGANGFSWVQMDLGLLLLPMLWEPVLLLLLPTKILQTQRTTDYAASAATPAVATATAAIAAQGAIAAVAAAGGRPT